MRMPTKSIEMAEISKCLPTAVESGQVHFIVDRGRARAVILPIEQYHAMMDAVEELDFLRNASSERRTMQAIVRG
jgi:PHD/YefM family antitoxin component YafN of YafNO toxin-antitoxin module